MGLGGLISPVSVRPRAYTRWFYGICLAASRGNTAFVVIGNVFMAPVEILWPVRMDELIYTVGNVQAGNIRVALYEDGPAGDIPDGGALVMESGSVAQAGAAGIQIVPIVTTMAQPGLYWFALMGDNIAATYIGFRDSAFILGRGFANSIGYGVFDDPCPVTGGITYRPECAIGVLENLPI